jgi:hypothetical protein
LDYIRNIDSPLDFLIESHFHQTAKGVSMAIQQSFNRSGAIGILAFVRDGNQFSRVLGVRPHVEYYRLKSVRPTSMARREISSNPAARTAGHEPSMTSTDPSLDARIWAYVRGEGGHAERKKLELEVSSSPVAARRYASIKLKHQREKSRHEVEPEAPKALQKLHVNNKAKSPTPSSNVDFAILMLALLHLITAAGLYVTRKNWPPITLLAIRDGLQFVVALLAIASALFVRSGRVGVLALVVGCIAASCAIAVMLVR